jgi:hypothetical protein
MDAMPLITTAPSRTLSAVLRALAADTGRERIAIADLLAALGDRAIGALLFVFAFPNVLPTPPGTSTVLGAPLIFLAAQLAFGWRPWLPAIVARRSMAQTDFAALVQRIAPWLERAEKLLRPRWSGLARPPMEHAVGAVCLLLALILVLPIPLGNMLPALALCLLALGVLERDGLWVLAGLGTAVAAIAVAWGVVFALVKTALFLLPQILN